MNCRTIVVLPPCLNTPENGLEDSDRSRIQVYTPTLQHLSVHSWFIVLQPAAQEVQTLLIEALRHDSAHFENFQSATQCMHGYLCF